MANLKHLSKTPFAIWCDESLKIEPQDAEPRRSTFPTEVTCMSCLRRAVIWFESKYFEANGERSFHKKESNHG